eukprot:7084254-Heterocapsa_arctica.AAC.1
MIYHLISLFNGYPRLGLRGWDDSFSVNFSLTYNLSQCGIQMISITSRCQVCCMQQHCAPALTTHSCGARVAAL